MNLHRYISDTLGYLRLYRFHLLIWVIFIVYEVSIVTIMNGRFGTLSNYVIHYFINIGLFYLHSTVVMPWVFKKNHKVYWLMALCIIVQATIYVFFVYNLDQFLIQHTNILGEVAVETENLLARVTWRGIYFLMFGTGYYFFTAYLATREEKEAIEREKLLNEIHQEKMAKDLMVAKNAYLKAQINPHFLFNTLDFIYHDVAKYSSASGEAVLTLADIMRFALDVEHYGDFITIGKELVQLEKFIDIRRLTHNDQPLIDLDYQDDIESIKIVPLVLLTLAENMIKHGDLEQSNGTIRIFKIGDNLHIITMNKIAKEQQATSFGSGLWNIKERLRDAYKENAELEFLTEGDHFKVEVSIPVDE